MPKASLAGQAVFNDGLQHHDCTLYYYAIWRNRRDASGTENTLFAYDQFVAKWFYGPQEPIRLTGDVLVVDRMSIFVKDTDIHRSCMKINFASQDKRGAQ